MAGILMIREEVHNCFIGDNRKGFGLSLKMMD